MAWHPLVSKSRSCARMQIIALFSERSVVCRCLWSFLFVNTGRGAAGWGVATSAEPKQTAARTQRQVPTHYSHRRNASNTAQCISPRAHQKDHALNGSSENHFIITNSANAASTHKSTWVVASNSLKETQRQRFYNPTLSCERYDGTPIPFANHLDNTPGCQKNAP